MNLSAPTQLVFLISIFLTVISILIFIGSFSIGVPPFWLMFVAYIVLVAGNLFKGM